MRRTSVRHYPETLTGRLVAWCDENAEAAPAGVVAVGLAYVFGFNEHQMGRIRLVRGPELRVSVPLARRAGDMTRAEFTEVSLEVPEWLGRGARALVGARVEGLLFVPRSTVGRPLSSNYFRQIVLDAGLAAVGRRLSPAGLNASRIVHGADRGLRLLAYETGLSAVHAARLSLADGIPRTPARA